MNFRLWQGDTILQKIKIATLIRLGHALRIKRKVSSAGMSRRADPMRATLGEFGLGYQQI